MCQSVLPPSTFPLENKQLMWEIEGGFYALSLYFLADSNANETDFNLHKRRDLKEIRRAKIYLPFLI